MVLILSCQELGFKDMIGGRGKKYSNHSRGQVLNSLLSTVGDTGSRLLFLFAFGPRLNQNIEQCSNFHLLYFQVQLSVYPQIYSFNDITKHLLSLYIVLLASYNTVQKVLAISIENGFILIPKAYLFLYINLFSTIIL